MHSQLSNPESCFKILEYTLAAYSFEGIGQEGSGSMLPTSNIHNFLNNNAIFKIKKSAYSGDPSLHRWLITEHTGIFLMSCLNLQHSTCSS